MGFSNVSLKRIETVILSENTRSMYEFEFLRLREPEMRDVPFGFFVFYRYDEANRRRDKIVIVFVSKFRNLRRNSGIAYIADVAL